jgi:hypothetical protein
VPPDRTLEIIILRPLGRECAADAGNGKGKRKDA